MVSNVINVLLITVVFILFILALPAMIASVDTSSGSLLENESVPIKVIYSQLPTIFLIVPLMLLGVGMFVALKSLN